MSRVYVYCLAGFEIKYLDYVILGISSVTAFFFFLNNNLKFLFIFGCAGSCCCSGFSLVAASGATLRCIVQASYCNGFFCQGAQGQEHEASVVMAFRLSS